MIVGQALIVLVGVFVLLWIVTSIAENLAALMQSAFVAALAAVAFQIFATPDSLLPSILFGLVVFVLTLRKRLSARKKRSVRARRQARLTKREATTTPVPSMASIKPTEPIEKTLGLPDASTLIAAWDKAAELCPRENFAPARENCAHLIKLARGEQTADFDVIERASFVRTQVPALIAETAKFCETCGSEQKEEATRNLTRQLKEIGAMALDKNLEYKKGFGAALALRRAHIAERLSSFSRQRE